MIDAHCKGSLVPVLDSVLSQCEEHGKATDVQWFFVLSALRLCFGGCVDSYHCPIFYSSTAFSIGERWYSASILFSYLGTSQFTYLLIGVVICCLSSMLLFVEYQDFIVADALMRFLCRKPECDADGTFGNEDWKSRFDPFFILSPSVNARSQFKFYLSLFVSEQLALIFIVNNYLQLTLIVKFLTLKSFTADLYPENCSACVALSV